MCTYTYTIGIRDRARALSSVSDGLAGSIDLIRVKSKVLCFSLSFSFVVVEHDNKSRLENHRLHVRRPWRGDCKTYEWLPFVPDIVVERIFRWDSDRVLFLSRLARATKCHCCFAHACACTRFVEIAPNHCSVLGTN